MERRRRDCYFYLICTDKRRDSWPCEWRMIYLVMKSCYILIFAYAEQLCVVHVAGTEYVARENKQPRKTDKVCKGGITRKLGNSAYCIACMTATENLQTGEYLSSHSCHIKPSIKECKFLPLSPPLHQKVQENCTAGILRK